MAPTHLDTRTERTTATFACAAMLVSYLPFSAVNGVLGTIGGTTSDLQWVAAAFTAALVATVLSGGVLGDLHGRRRVALIGLALTVTCTVVGFLAGDLIPVLWLGQAAGGLGAGLVMSSTLALIAARTRAIAAWAASNVVGLGAGPFLSGVITEHADWHWLYPPITVLAITVMVLGATRAQESSAPEGRSPDWPGQLTSAAGIVALVYGVITGGSTGWTSPQALIGLTTGVAFLTTFVLIEHHSTAPLLRPTLFTSRGFTAAGLSAMVVLFTIVGIVFVLSLFFAHQHVTALGIAVRLACLFGGNAAASLTAAHLQTRFSPRAVLIAGPLVAAAGLTTLLTTTDTTTLTGFAGPLLLTGAGCGLVIATSTAVAVHSVPRDHSGMAGAANNALRQLGGALGAAVVGVIFATTAHTSYTNALHTCAISLAALLVLTATTTHFLTRENT
ncbi:MFS transporter [Umezawaea sp. NPDC059074]|uniref:MFS transporter n=1 Tax=Umezawaea sp. NPDC059074 TaxID=3346716 RepID=UPI0036913415